MLTVDDPWPSPPGPLQLIGTMIIYCLLRNREMRGDPLFYLFREPWEIEPGTTAECWQLPLLFRGDIFRALSGVGCHARSLRSRNRGLGLGGRRGETPCLFRRGGLFANGRTLCNLQLRCTGPVLGLLPAMNIHDRAG